MVLHVDALFTHEQGRMVRVNEPRGKPAPRFFLGRTTDGTICRFRHDVAPEVVRQLEALARAEDSDEAFTRPPYGAPPYEALLAPAEHTEAGPAYRFPDRLDARSGIVMVTEANADILAAHLPAWLGDPPTAQPFAAVVVDGHAVAVCASVRITNAAHEAGVDTAPAFRRQGHGAKAVAAWARAVRDMDRQPLYSTSWNNTASQALAASLGLIRFGHDLSIE
jgi:RimJ/RimL family protein N-acetyltransferase